jgi:hypothetical protein
MIRDFNRAFDRQIEGNGYMRLWLVLVASLLWGIGMFVAWSFCVAAKRRERSLEETHKESAYDRQQTLR